MADDNAINNLRVELQESIKEVRSETLSEIRGLRMELKEASDKLHQVEVSQLELRAQMDRIGDGLEAHNNIASKRLDQIDKDLYHNGSGLKRRVYDVELELNDLQVMEQKRVKIREDELKIKEQHEYDEKRDRRKMIYTIVAAIIANLAISITGWIVAATATSSNASAMQPSITKSYEELNK